MSRTEVSIQLVDSSGIVVDVVKVRRPYYLPLKDVEVVETSSNLISLQVSKSGGAARVDSEGVIYGDVPVGALPILNSKPNGHLDVVFLKLPAPAPFSLGDIDSIWEQASSLPLPALESVRRDALSGAHSNPDRRSIHIPALPQLLEVASHVACRWPQKEASEVFWRPVGTFGGRENLRHTLRNPWRSGAAKYGKRSVPERSARHRAATEAWRLSSVTAILRECREQIQSLKDNTLDSALHILDRVISQCRPVGRQLIDPPPSSWPVSMRALYQAAWLFVTQTSILQRGADQAPLCHVWKLYETWVASRVYDTLSLTLGAPHQKLEVVERNSQNEPVLHATWRANENYSVELWIQKEIKRKSSPALPVVSCTSSLIPDCLVMMRSDSDIKVLVIDAKYRGERQMTAGELGEACSKYLWGIRLDSDHHQFALSKVIIAASSRVAMPFNESSALMQGVTVVPGSLDKISDVLKNFFHHPTNPDFTVKGCGNLSVR